MINGVGKRRMRISLFVFCFGVAARALSVFVFPS